MTSITCTCGFDKTHPAVSPHYKYSLWGWVLFGIGITPKPVELSYKCARCGTVIETVRDREALERYLTQ